MLIVFTAVLCACCGLRCWLVLGLLGAATHLEWFGRHPAWLERFSVLGDPVALAVFIGIYLVEFGIDKTPRLDACADRLHLVFRPLAGAAVAFLAFQPQGLAAALPAAMAGAAIAWFVHLQKARLRRRLNRDKPLFRTVGISVAEDVVAGLGLWLAFGLIS